MVPIARRVHDGAAVQEQPSHVGVAHHRRGHQRAKASVCRRLEVDSPVQQHLHDVAVSHERGHQERSQAAFGPDLGIGTSFQEQPHDGRVPPRGRGDDRLVVPPRFRADAGAGVEEGLHCLHVPVARREKERRHVVCGFPVGIRTAVEEVAQLVLAASVFLVIR